MQQANLVLVVGPAVPESAGLPSLREVLALLLARAEKRRPGAVEAIAELDALIEEQRLPVAFSAAKALLGLEYHDEIEKALADNSAQSQRWRARWQRSRRSSRRCSPSTSTGSSSARSRGTGRRSTGRWTTSGSGAASSSSCTGPSAARGDPRRGARAINLRRPPAPGDRRGALPHAARAVRRVRSRRARPRGAPRAHPGARGWAGSAPLRAALVNRASAAQAGGGCGRADHLLRARRGDGRASPPHCQAGTGGPGNGRRAGVDGGGALYQFPGLEFFDVEDAGDFFGRTAISDAVARLGGARPAHRRWLQNRGAERRGQVVTGAGGGGAHGDGAGMGSRGAEGVAVRGDPAGVGIRCAAW